MANTGVNLIREALGTAGAVFDLPVKASTHLYEGALVSQSSGGYLVPYSTASSGVCVGVTQHEADNSSGADGAMRCLIESDRTYVLKNGAGGDAFADTDLIGSLVYGTDDNTAAKTSSTQTRQPVGFFMGFESDSKVRVRINPAMARIVSQLQALTDTPATADALRDNIVASFG